MSQTCVRCHVVGGQAGSTRLVLDPDNLDATRAAIARVAAILENGTSLLLLKPSGAIAHSGGVILPVGSEEYGNLQALVARLQLPEKCDDGLPFGTKVCADEPTQVVRTRLLTRAEIDNTLARVFDVADKPATALLPIEPRTNGYDNSATLTMQELRSDQAFTMASVVANKVTASLDAQLPCDPNDGEDACATAFASVKASAAYRRPVTDDEVAGLVAIYRAERDRGGAFADGISLIVQAILTSPHFLYRVELAGGTGTSALSMYELAAALSYTLTAGPPDDELHAAAEYGSLQDSEVVRGQARRLLETTEGHAQMQRFVLSWLGIDKIDNADKSSDVYPGFDGGARADMRKEAELFVEHVLYDDDGKLATLLTAPYSYVTDRLAGLYGVDRNSDDGLVTFEKRPGILTRGATMAAFALPTGSSPVRRGQLVRTRLLCQELPPPPSDINMNPPPLAGEIHTTRDRFAAHSRSESCQSCHRMLDGVGFAFEGFDGIGQQRTQENGFPIDTTGSLLGTPSSDGSFDDESGLLSLLAGSEDVKRCFVQNWTMFAQGDAGAYSSHCASKDAVDRFRGSDGDMLDLIIHFSASPSFTTRRAGN